MKLTVKDILKIIEEKIPTSLAEEWDNVGLQIGSLQTEITGVLTTLDVTKEAVDYAIRRNCNFIFSHHPFFFKGMKQILTDSYKGAIISKLIRHKITVYSAHTNLDIALGGLNDMAVKRLGLLNIRGLHKTGEESLVKIVVFVPRSHGQKVRMAMAEAGAGYIGKYSHCSFSVEGMGRFKPLKGTNPYIGTVNAIESVEEERIETIAKERELGKILKAMFEAHPYEEVAYDIYPLLVPKQEHFLGRIGQLPREMTLEEFAHYVQQAFPKGRLRMAGAKRSMIHKVALCTGSAAEFLKTANAKGAHAYITGDVKYHDGQMAKEMGITLVDMGHFGTEEFVAQGIKDMLINYCPKEFWDTVPIKVYTDQEDFFFIQ